MSNIRYFKAESEIENFIFLKVYCRDNRYHELTLNKEKLCSYNSETKQYSISVEVLRAEGEKQLAIKSPISVRGIINFKF